MKNLAINVLVLCAFVGAAYSFKCYKCGPEGDVDYSVDQCEKDQKEIDCPSANYTCARSHGISLSGKKEESRGCISKVQCDNIKKICESGTVEQKKFEGVKECEVACCVSDGDKPCNDRTSVVPDNGGFTVSTDMFLIMFAVLCSLKLF